MIKAVFFDVDGTLYSHTQGAVPPSALRALYRLREKGILVFLSTGRHLCELKVLPLPSFAFDGYVTLTGQLCLDGAFRPFYRRFLDPEDQKPLIRAFEEKKIPMLLANEELLYINFVNDRVRRVQRDIATPLPPVGEYRGEEIYIAVAYCAGAEREALISPLRHTVTSAWHPSGFDLIPADSGKAVGIRETEKRFGFAPEETMAFGDGENDLDMLRHAGVGVALGNGAPALKAAADFVTDPIDEDGVEKALRHFGLLA